jgi:predicted GNAT superfamily acetyltransferase
VTDFRPIQSADISAIVELNDAAYPAVPITSVAEMTALVALAGFTSVLAADAGPVQAFLIGLRPGAAYASENYRYFEARGTDFLYVDRIVVAESLRGRQVGRSLYESVFALARAEGRAEVTCEVNLDPPNPGSLAFHARMGFARVGEQPTKNGTVTVALLAAPVPATPPEGH